MEIPSQNACEFAANVVSKSLRQTLDSEVITDIISIVPELLISIATAVARDDCKYEKCGIPIVSAVASLLLKLLNFGSNRVINIVTKALNPKDLVGVRYCILSMILYLVKDLTQRVANKENHGTTHIVNLMSLDSRIVYVVSGGPLPKKQCAQIYDSIAHLKLKVAGDDTDVDDRILSYAQFLAETLGRGNSSMDSLCESFASKSGIGSESCEESDTEEL